VLNLAAESTAGSTPITSAPPSAPHRHRAHQPHRGSAIHQPQPGGSNRPAQRRSFRTNAGLFPSAIRNKRPRGEKTVLFGSSHTQDNLATAQTISIPDKRPAQESQFPEMDADRAGPVAGHNRVRDRSPQLRETCRPWVAAGAMGTNISTEGRPRRPLLEWLHAAGLKIRQKLRTLQHRCSSAQVEEDISVQSSASALATAAQARMWAKQAAHVYVRIDDNRRLIPCRPAVAQAIRRSCPWTPRNGRLLSKPQQFLRSHSRILSYSSATPARTSRRWR